MKNFKRLAIAAAIAVMAFGVTAFADAASSSFVSNTVVKLDDTSVLTAGVEYTVVLTKTGDTISDANILYINQGDKNAAFWANMGSIRDLELKNGSYTLTIAAKSVPKFTVAVTVNNNTVVEIGNFVESTNEAGKYIVYAECLDVTAADADKYIAITKGNETRLSSQTIAQLLNGEVEEGASFEGTLAVGVITTDDTATFTAALQSAN